MAWQTNSTFTKDLAEAHGIENKLADIFTNNWNCTVTTSQDFGSFPDYDVAVEFTDTNRTETFEVKYDKKSAITGNIAVEFQRTLKDGTVKPTCVSLSKADWYAYYFDKEFYLIPTAELKDIIEQKKYFRIINGVGDGGRASCYLFKKEVFKKYAEPIKKIIADKS